MISVHQPEKPSRQYSRSEASAPRWPTQLAASRFRPEVLNAASSRLWLIIASSNRIQASAPISSEAWKRNVVSTGVEGTVVADAG